MGKRELVAVYNLSSWYLVMVEWLFLAVPWGCLRFVIVVFPDHTYLIFLKRCNPTCASSQTAQCICSSLSGEYNSYMGWRYLLHHQFLFTQKFWHTIWMVYKTSSTHWLIMTETLLWNSIITNLMLKLVEKKIVETIYCHHVNICSFFLKNVFIFSWK